MAGDTISVEDDDQKGEKLIQQVMQAGKRIGPRPSLESIRVHSVRELTRLPEALHSLEPGAIYPVEVGEALVGLVEEFDRHLREQDQAP